jgi:hypothetical protein
MPAKTVDEAVRLVEWTDGQKKNCYFALATFQEEHLNKNGKRRVARKRKNVDKLKALWVDIDFKDCSEPSLQGALKDVSKFLRESDFPKPTAMVSSGNGLHLYWPFAEEVSYDRWHPLAVAFKQMCQSFGLPADHACTADSARVLRPVGTHNYKDAANPKPVEWVGGSGTLFDHDDLRRRMGGLGSKTMESDTAASDAIPSHLRDAANAAKDRAASEFTRKGERTQITKQVFQKCGVMRHVLKTGGKDQGEPEWNATMMLLAHLDEGAKFVHKMSEGHISYDPDDTMEKWQQKVEAVEEGSGPTLCRTFEGYYPDICQKCAFYKSKKVKTPKSLAYLEPETPAPQADKSSSPRLTPASAFQQANYPKGWRVDGNRTGVERKVWSEEDKDYHWVPTLFQIWELRKATRNIRERDYQLTLYNEHRGDATEIPCPAGLLGTSTDLTKLLATYGAPIVDANELRSFKQLMSTWIADLRAANAVEEVTDQLGWIDKVDDDEHTSETIGFACGTDAYYRDGTHRSGVVAVNSKHRGIVKSFEPVGDIAPWREAVSFLVEQGCNHLITMVASAFAGPLMRFTGQNGGVLSIVSEDSGAGKSTGMSVAQAVWGDPANAPATIQDTPTVVKNKLAYLQNVTAYWDEVRGDDQIMTNFVQIAFQVSQGRDRERANSNAETIRAQTWKTLLATASNDSLYDIAAGKLGESDAGVYRIYELKVSKSEFPTHDPVIASAVVDLQTNFGHAGKIYAKWLVDNFERLAPEVHEMRLKIEKAVGSTSPERFWIATITSLIMGARFANAAGLTKIDEKALLKYLIDGLHKLRARTLDSRTQLSPRELVASYAMQHQDGKVTVDWFPCGRGGNRERVPILQGNHQHVRKVSYVIAEELDVMRVSKSDFTTWLRKSKNIRLNDKLRMEFERDLRMTEQKAVLAAGTKFAVPRAACLTFKIKDEIEDDDDAE